MSQASDCKKLKIIEEVGRDPKKAISCSNYPILGKFRRSCIAPSGAVWIETANAANNERVKLVASPLRGRCGLKRGPEVCTAESPVASPLRGRCGLKPSCAKRRAIESGCIAPSGAVWIETPEVSRSHCLPVQVASPLRGRCGLKPVCFRVIQLPHLSCIAPSGAVWIETDADVYIEPFCGCIAPSGAVWIETPPPGQSAPAPPVASPLRGRCGLKLNVRGERAQPGVASPLRGRCGLKRNSKRGNDPRRLLHRPFGGGVD